MQRQTARFRETDPLLGGQSPPGMPSRSLVYGKHCRSRKARKGSAPVCLCASRVLCLEPADIVVIGAQSGKCDRLVASNCLISSSKFCEDLGHRPAVEQQ